MCYDIAFTVNLKEIGEYFPDAVISDQVNIDFQSDHIMGHSYAPHPILYRERPTDKLILKPMEWGVIPFYEKDKERFSRLRASMLNIRSERILDDPKSYWYKIRDRRCLIPISGFYEHREIAGWKKKAPYYINLKLQETFFIPGLYSVTGFVDKTTGEINETATFGLITRSANAVMKAIHNCGDNKWRMPLMIPLEMSKQWIESKLPEEKYRRILNYEMPSQELNYTTVYTIRSPKLRPDNAEKHEPYAWPDLPPLEIV